VGVQIIHDPIITLHAGEVLIRLVEVGNKICGCACRPQAPGDVPGGHGQRVDEHARAMANVLVFTTLALPRLGRLRRRCALQHLHTGLFIAADQQPALLVGLQGFHIQLANGLRLGIKVLVMTVEPVCTFMRLEIDLVQDTPDA
jgi:hypothetical protein